MSLFPKTKTSLLKFVTKKKVLEDIEELENLIKEKKKKITHHEEDAICAYNFALDILFLLKSEYIKK